MNKLSYDVYKALRDMDIVNSANQFSREWLGRSSRIYSYYKATGNPPAIEIMLGLFARLEALCAKSEKCGHFETAHALDILTTRLWAALMDECLAKRPHARKRKSNYSQAME